MSVLTERVMLRLESLLKHDEVVLKNTKWYKATLLLVSDTCRWGLHFSNGDVKLLKDEEIHHPFVSISGPDENWKKVLDGLPGGLHRSFRHKLFKFEGDPVLMLSIWKTIWRVGEALAQIGKEEQ